MQLEENNSYLDRSVFNKIFDFVSNGASRINLYVEPDSENVKMLWYEHVQGLAKGEQEAMEKLKGAIEGLLIDKEIISRVTEYKTLMNQLTNDEQINYMRIVIRVSYLYYGGHIVGGYPACSLCDPDVPFEYESTVNT